MFNKSEIMRTAWEHFRWVRSEYAPWQIERGLIDASFANALRIAWRIAKEAAEEAARHLALTTGPNAARAAAIQYELDGLTYKTLRCDVPAMRRTLTAELAALA